MHSRLFLHAVFQLAVIVLLAVVPFISATPNPSQSPRKGVHIRDPVIQTPNGLAEGWSSLGCYTNNPEQPALTSFEYESDVLTIEDCVNTCNGFYYIYAGIENGVNCYCGNVLTVGTTSVSASDCSSPCVGNHDEICGGNVFGDGHLSLYSSWTSATPPPQPSFVQSVGSWTLMGCYSDSDEARTLSVQVAGHISIENCVGTCETEGYRLAGMEFAYECWCGHSVENDALMLDDTYCPLACSLNSSEMCGGAHTLVMYHNNGTGD